MYSDQYTFYKTILKGLMYSFSVLCALVAEDEVKKRGNRSKARKYGPQSAPKSLATPSYFGIKWAFFLIMVSLLSCKGRDPKGAFKVLIVLHTLPFGVSWNPKQEYW